MIYRLSDKRQSQAQCVLNQICARSLFHYSYWLFRTVELTHTHYEGYRGARPAMHTDHKKTKDTLAQELSPFFQVIYRKMLINIYGVVINPLQYKWLTISFVIFCNVISMPCDAQPITHMAAMWSRPMTVMSSHLHQSADWSGTSFDPVCPLHDFLNRPIHLQPCSPSTSSREMQNIIFYYYIACLT